MSPPARGAGRCVCGTREGDCRRDGCDRDEIIYYGVDGVSWRGAVYRAEVVNGAGFDAQAA
jgi:hypothetical protein